LGSDEEENFLYEYMTAHGRLDGGWMDAQVNPRKRAGCGILSLTGNENTLNSSVLHHIVIS
jgi:hypothetical protein